MVFPDVGITIGLESATYSVDEGRGSLWACTVVRSGLLGNMLIITMFTQDGSATGGNVWFMLKLVL